MLMEIFHLVFASFYHLAGGHKELIGMSCVLANRIKGYVYDIFERCKLITAVSFMSRLAFYINGAASVNFWMSIQVTDCVF